MHEEYKYQSSETVSYSLDAWSQGMMHDLTVWTSTPAPVLFILAAQEHSPFFFLFDFDHMVEF